jgi:fibronectin-binding autotransporter adhesin
MKMKTSRASIVSCVTFATCFTVTALLGQTTQTYDDTNVANVWDLSTANWNASTLPWTNGNNATFAGVGEAVDVDAAITVGNITFSVGGYSIVDTTANGTLTLGATSNIAVTNLADTAIINEILAGAAGFTKSGAGILELGGVNTYGGITTISTGTIKLANNSALGVATNTNHTIVAAGATLDLNGTTIAEQFGQSTTTFSDGFGGATAILTNSSGTAAAITGDIVFDGAGAFTVNGTGDISLTRPRRANGTSGDNVITKDGSGTLTLLGTLDNTATATVVNNGVLLLAKTSSSSVHALGGTSTVNSTGTLRLGGSGDDQIFNNVDMTINGTFDLNGKNETINNLSGASTGIVSNTATNDASTLTVGSNNGTTTFNGVIQDGTGTSIVGLTKTGSGTFTLTNNNTYTGTTALNAFGGGLTLDFAAVGGTNDNLISASSALSFTNTSSVRPQILRVTGDASVTNNQTFNGTTIAAGANRYQIVATSGTGGTTNLNLGALTVGAGSFLDFVLPASGAINTTNPNTVFGPSGTVNNGASYAQILGGQIVAFNGDLVYVTATNIAALPGYTATGNLRVDNTSAGNVIQAAGSTLLSTVQFTDTANRTLTLGTGNTLQVGGILRTATAGSVIIGEAGNAGELTSGTTAGADLILTNGNATGSLTVNSVIKNNAGGAVDVFTNGPGTTILAGNNTYTGATQVQIGSTLRATSSTSLGTVAGGVGVQEGAALELAGGISIGAEAISIAGTGIASGGALRNLSGNNSLAGSLSWTVASTVTTVAGNLTLNGALSVGNLAPTFNTAAGTEIFVNGIITQGGTSNNAITKNGAGTLTLNASNNATLTGTGAVDISGGTLKVGNVAALATTATRLTNLSTANGGGTLQLATDTSVNAFLIGGSSSNPGTLISDRATAGAGITHVLGAASIGNNTFTFQAGTNVTSGAAGVSFASLNLNAGSAGTLTLNPTTSSLTIVGAVNIGSNNFAKTLALGGTNAANFINGAISNNLNTLTLTKSNTSTWTLANTNTYTGATTVSAGTLNLTGANTGTSGITVSSGATLNVTDTGSLGGAVPLITGGTTTLSGTNTSTGATTINGGTLTLNYDTGAAGTNTTKLANASLLTLSGGTVVLSGGSHLEQVGSTTLTANTALTRPSGTSVLALGAVTATGGSLSIAGNDLASTTTANTNGILSWATVTISGVTEFGTNSGVTDGGTGSFIRAYAGAYTDITRLGVSTVPDDATQNVRIINGGTTGNVTLASTANEINSLKMDASDGPSVITMTGSTLNIGTDAGGGIIQTATSGGLTVGAFDVGTLTTGATANATGASLSLSNDSLTNDLTINSIIANNGTDIVSLAKNGAGRVVLAGTNTFTGSVQINAGTLHVGETTGAGTTTTGILGTAVAVVNNGSLVFRRQNNINTDVAGVISGTGSVTYNGIGSLDRSQYNVTDASTYSGGTTIGLARATASNVSSFGTGLVTVQTGGSAFLNTGATFANNFNISGNGWLEGSGNLGALRLANGTTVSGSVTLAANSRITTSSGGTGIISGNIIGGFNLEVGEDSATGVVSLTANNSATFTGAASVSAGAFLNVGNNGALGDTVTGTTVNGVTTGSGLGTELRLAAGVTVTDETLTLNVGSGQRGSLNMQVAGTSAWDGNILLSAVGGGSIAANTAGAILNIGSSSTDTITGTNNALSIRGAGGVGTINSAISLGTGAISKTDSGSWTLAHNANAYSGSTTISQGILSFGTIAASGVISSIGSGTSIVIGQNQGGASGTGTLQFTGASGGSSNRAITVFNGASGGAAVIENTVAGQTLTLSGNVTSQTPASASALTLAGAGNGELNGNINGTPAMSVTKTGLGTWTLGGANTYSGATLVSAGTLSLANTTGSATGSGTVTVATGGKLAGTNGSGELGSLIGTVTGPVTVQSGGRIAPGNSIGTLRLTNLTMDAGSIADLEITNTSSTDRILIDGTLTLSDSATINVLPLTLTSIADGDIFNLLDWTTLASTTFDVGTNLRNGGNGGGDLFLPDISGFGVGDYVWEVSSFLTNGQISVTTAIVPEPSRALLLFAGLALAFLRRRR